MKNFPYFRVAIAGLISILSAAASAVVPLSYDLTVIDPPSGMTNVTLVAINNAGEIAANANNGGGLTGYIYSQDTSGAYVYEEVGGNNGNGVNVHDISDTGTVVADLWLTPNSPVNTLGGFKRRGDTSFTVLSSPGGGRFRPTAINSLDQAVGIDFDTARAVFYDNVTSSNIGPIGSTAWAINDLGQVPVGESTPQPVDQCFIEFFDNGQVTGIAQTVTLTNPLAATNISTCIVRDLNNQGQMVISWGNLDTYYYDHSTGVFTLINVLGLDQYAINEAGVVVGRNASGAVIYDEGQIIELNSLMVVGSDGLFLEKAFDINEAGQIIGRARASDSSQFNIAIVLTPTNAPPILDAIGPQSVAEGEPLEIQLSALDPENGMLQFTGTNLSATGDDSLAAIGAMLDPDSGLFSWTPSFDQAGNYEIQFTVTDDALPGKLDMEVVMITVGNINRPPLIAPIPPLDVAAGVPLDVMIVVSDPDGDMVSVVASNLPAGAVISGNGSSLQWTPTVAQLGTHIIDIVATDTGTPSLQTNSAVSITVGGAVTPQELIDLLIDDTRALGNLPQNLDRRLVQRLRLAKKHLAKGKVNKAIREIDRYIALLMAGMASGNIPSDPGDTLLAVAQQLRVMLAT